MSDRLTEIHEVIQKEQRQIKPSKNSIELWDGCKLQYHIPTRSQGLSIDLNRSIPEDKKSFPLEVEIGPGKGEFLANRASLYPEKYFLGIDRRLDRVQLTENKLKRTDHQNWQIIREDACSFNADLLPEIDTLHLYQPDPWPKSKHHKHRFFRSPEAEAFSMAVRKGGELRLSTDHIVYFYEMLQRVKTWGCFSLTSLIEKQSHMSLANSHFENIFLKKNEPVFKAHFTRV